MRNKHEC